MCCAISTLLATPVEVDYNEAQRYLVEPAQEARGSFMSVSIFFCYAHEDEDLLNKLKRHLWPLQRQGLIAVWHDRDISAGTEWEQEISQHLNEVQIILL